MELDAGLQTSIPGIFATGNVAYMHDLVDNVVREAAAVAGNAVSFLQGTAPQAVPRFSLQKDPAETVASDPHTQRFPCVVCPNSCLLTVHLDAAGQIAEISGHRCRRGKAYARQDILDPHRTLTGNIAVKFLN